MSSKKDRLEKINSIVNDDILGYLGASEQIDNTNTLEDAETPQNEVKKDKLEGVNDIANKEVYNIPKNTKKKTISKDKQGKIRKDKQGNIIYTKKDNSAITIKIDADIEDYLKNIEMIAFIESYKRGRIESTTKTNYVNSLIRQDFIDFLELDENATSDEMLLKWLEYKRENNMK